MTFFALKSITLILQSSDPVAIRVPALFHLPHCNAPCGNKVIYVTAIVKVLL